MISVSKAKIQNIDKWLIAAVCALTVFGIVCVGSALRINLGEDATKNIITSPLAKKII